MARTLLEIDTSEPELVQVDTEDKRCMKYIEGKLGVKPAVKPNLGRYYPFRGDVIKLVNYLLRLK